MALEDLLNPLFGVPIEAGTQLRYMCPLCGSSKQKLFVSNDQFSKKFGQWICFNCGESGNLTSLLMKGLHIPFSQASQMIVDGGVMVANRAFDENLSNNENIMVAISNRQLILDEQEPLDQIEIPNKPAPALPYGLKYFRNHYNDAEAQPFLQYLEGRGFPRAMVTQLGYGYIVNGYAVSSQGHKIPIQNHVVFFTYNDKGECTYWNTRAIYPVQHGPKSINAPNTKTNDWFGKGDLIYNANEALKQPVIILTEGVPDALTLFPYGVATFGKQITDFQKGILVQKLKPEQKLIVMLDMDASYLLIQTAKEIYRYHKNTRMVFNYTRKDANSLGKRKAFEVIKNGLYIPDDLGIIKFNLMLQNI